MRRLVIAASLALVLIIGSWWGYGLINPPQGESPDQSSVAEADDESLVSASATLLPERYALLSPRAGGRIQSIAVAAGQEVAAGDVLVELVSADLQAGVAQAEAVLAAAQADLARIRSGARAEEVAQA